MIPINSHCFEDNMFRVKNNDKEFIEELVQRADAAVKGYESYLLDKLDSKELAVIMKKLHNTLSMFKKTRESYSEPLGGDYNDQ
jgi:hypothetical protein